MTRAALFLVTLVATLPVIGCARGRDSVMPPPVVQPSAGPFPNEPVEEPTRASLNQGKIPKDLQTVRASYEPPPEPSQDAPRVRPPTSSPFGESPPPSTPERPRPVADAPPTSPSEATPSASEPAAPPAPAAEPTPSRGQEPGASRPPVKPAAGSGEGAMSIRADAEISPGKPAARTAAVVGNTIITHRDLKVALFSQGKITPQEFSQLNDEQRYEMLRGTLEQLIDRTLILQDARRDLFKKDEQWKKLTEYVTKTWREKELPPLLRNEGVEDEISLRRKLEARGESLDDVKEVWKIEAMSRELMMIRVKDKVAHPGLADLEKYYAEHRKDSHYHRDAKVKWREMLVAADTPEALPAARQKAQALRARLLAGEDFAALAKSSSAGVTAAQGGYWETAPDSTASPALNAALKTLAAGQISGPIEGPKGVHIIRVEGRTQEGPAPFVDVQREIADKLFSDRFSAAVDAYLKKLRSKTAITSPLFRGITNTSALAGGQDVPKRDPETRPASAR